MSNSFNKQQGFNDFQCQTWLISATACQLHSSRVVVQLKKVISEQAVMYLLKKYMKNLQNLKRPNFSSALLWLLYAVA